MLNKFFQVFKIPDLRKKIFIVALWLALFRILAAIPIPGIDPARLKSFFEGNDILGLLNIFSGGGLSNLSLMMLGVGPYITATIIMQLLTMIFPSLKTLYYEEGSMGRAKFNRYSRYLTVPLAALQSYGFLQLLHRQQVLPTLGLAPIIQNVILVTTGSLILTWIGEMISEQKIGNGVSLIIFAGIISRIPSAIGRLLISFDKTVLPTVISFVVIAILVIAGVVFVNEAERKIPVAYTKQVRGSRFYGGAMSYLPLKVNQAGVIPIIFALSVLLFPQFLGQILSVFSVNASLSIQNVITKFLNNQILYSIFYFLLVMIFTYFYTAITFNPDEIAKNLQRVGGFIPGMRPGQPSAAFLKSVVSKITLYGAIFLGLIAVFPNITRIFTGIQFLTIGGTALLIVVSVAIETIRQINSQLTMYDYEEIG